ncbi:MAG: hypothetical protein IPK17_20325 [Chloroflexi bacterium]|uniref:hypothetical protein n=1 Tax=Candidatus Flexifilum breve TaxID=3140694 RepID=UPI00313733CE|nr:hypothetical protein [Chloroflexota bacterium]
MCGLLTLLLVFGGFISVFGISSAVVMPVEPIGSVEVTAVQALPMTPTFTPTPARRVGSVLAPTMTPSPTALPPANPQIVSICAPPDQSDLQVAAAFEGNLLPSPAWMLSATSTESMTRFTWNNSAYGSVAMLELLHYDCGYTDDDIDAFYNEGVWDTLFASYESWKKPGSASSDGCVCMNSPRPTRARITPSATGSTRSAISAWPRLCSCIRNGDSTNWMGSPGSCDRICRPAPAYDRQLRLSGHVV